jgi:hypothetical protein
MHRQGITFIEHGLLGAIVHYRRVEQAAQDDDLLTQQICGPGPQ